MSNPNIVNVTTISGGTGVQAVGTSAAVFLENTAASNKIIKVNSILVANTNTTTSISVTIDLFRSSTSYKIAPAVIIPANSTLVALSKDAAIYLLEGDQLRSLASAGSALNLVVSYEEIS